MNVINENGKFLCPECKQLSDFKIFDIPGCESFMMCTCCGKIQTEKSLLEAEIELQKQRIFEEYKMTYPDGIISHFNNNNLFGPVEMIKQMDPKFHETYETIRKLDPRFFQVYDMVMRSFDNNNHLSRTAELQPEETGDERKL